MYGTACTSLGPGPLLSTQHPDIRERGWIEATAQCTCTCIYVYVRVYTYIARSFLIPVNSEILDHF